MKNKIIVYQLLPRLFSNINDTNKPWGGIEENGCGKLNEFKDTAIESLKKLGINCIWLTGIIRHATTTDYSQYKITKDNPLIVKGRAGSPYAITDYFDIDPDLAINVDNRMNEFVELVERIHKHDIKVIIDFVPNHVARNYNTSPNYGKNYISKTRHLLGANEDNSKIFEINNNFYYLPGEVFEVPQEAYDKLTNFMSRDEISEYSEFPAKATGNDCFSAKPSINDWYETVKLNYGIDYRYNSEFFDPIPNTWLCMNDILNFWAEKGVDGFRCDMAEMVPYQYWKWQIHQIKSKYPEMIFIAEIYKRNLYDLFLNEAKFDFLYDKVDMYDGLKDIITGKSKVNKITESWQRTNDFNNKMLRFMENHDEQRIASNFFSGDPFKALPACIVSAFLHNGPFMIYNCQELGEKAKDISGFSGDDGRTTIFDYWSMDCQRRWNNEGRFDEEKLTEKEISLRNKYSMILNEAVSEIVISQGKLYDLMWVNQHLIDLNCYAFIKTYENRHVIYVVNFNESSIEIELILNSHVFDFLGLQIEEKILNIKIPGYWYQKSEIK
ncbi:MAG: alpha-amylase family protein [Bacteroidales bacterium]|jgi:glycosidase|nr:alpha-amylase family protein [Bacteroidales bacterium]